MKLKPNLESHSTDLEWHDQVGGGGRGGVGFQSDFITDPLDPPVPIPFSSINGTPWTNAMDLTLV